jgi:hypothetical protein
MPRLFNMENALFQTFAVAACASNATKTATFTGVTTDDYVLTLQNNDLAATGVAAVEASISAADTIVFHPSGAAGAGSAVAQTVGVLIMVAPTSGRKGGSW